MSYMDSARTAVSEDVSKAEIRPGGVIDNENPTDETKQDPGEGSVDQRESLAGSN